MEKITKRRFDLVGKTIYREKSDCSYWELTDWRDIQSCYDAVKLDSETGERTTETAMLTPNDLIGDYVL